MKGAVVDVCVRGLCGSGRGGVGGLVFGGLVSVEFENVFCMF